MNIEQMYYEVIDLEIAKIISPPFQGGDDHCFSLKNNDQGWLMSGIANCAESTQQSASSNLTTPPFAKPLGHPSFAAQMRGNVYYVLLVQH